MQYRLERRARDGIYRIAWTEDGRTRRRSLGTRDQAAAAADLAAFVVEMEAPDVDDDATIGAILPAYVDARQRAGVVDVERLRLCAAHLVKHLGWLHAVAVKPSHGTTYAKTRAAEGVATGTIRRELGALQAALNWASNERLIPPPSRLERPASPPPRDRWLSREEAQRLLDACVSHHVRLFVEIALRTAARRDAILDLRWSQIDFDARLIRFGAGAGNKRRAIVPINDRLLSVLEGARAVATCDWVVEFDGERAGNPKKAFARACARAGLDDVTPHVLRHTAATWMAQDGVEMRMIALFLGHTTTATTERVYAHHSPDYLASAATALE